MTAGQYPDKTFVSVSAAKAYLQCQQRYTYQYIERLKPRARSPYLEFGTLLHSYLEFYYRGLKDGADPEAAHTKAIQRVRKQYIPELGSYVQAAFVAGDDELAASIEDLPNRFNRITERYFYARGRSDAERYEVLLVEERLNTHLNSNIVSVGVVDLVLRDNDTGLIALGEHKSTQSVPPAGLRLRDLQTLLYAEQLRHDRDLYVDQVIWNYLRTKEPTIPQLLKNRKVPTLSKATTMDSTWEIYALTAAEHGIDVTTPEYDEIREHLIDRELTTFFPRFTQFIVADKMLMMRDYLRTALEIRRFRRRIAERVVKPIRSLGFSCDFCDFNVLCTAAITGGDVTELKEMRFTKDG